MLSKIPLTAEIAAALFGCIYFYKYRRSPLRIWLILLFLAPLAEIIGDWYSNNITYNNHLVFNIYDVLGNLIILKMVYDYTTETLKKKAVLWLSITSVIVLVINCSFASFFTEFLLLYKTSVIFILIIVLAIFLIEILKSRQLISFKENLPFIVFSGYLLFNVVYLPIYITFRYLIDYEQEGLIIYSALHTLLLWTIVVVNLLFIFGLIWTKKTTFKPLIS